MYSGSHEKLLRYSVDIQEVSNHLKGAQLYAKNGNNMDIIHVVQTTFYCVLNNKHTYSNNDTGMVKKCTLDIQ